MTRTSQSGETLVPSIIVDPDGNPAHIVDTDGQSLISVQGRNMLWDTGLLRWVRQTVTYQGGGTVTTGSVSAYQAGSWAVSVSNFPGTTTVSGGVSVTSLPSNVSTKWGSQTAITVSSTVALASYVTPSTMSFWGCFVSGTADAKVVLTAGGNTIFTARLNSGAPTVVMVQPQGTPVGSGTTVTLSITNTGSGSGDYEGGFLIG